MPRSLLRKAWNRSLPLQRKPRWWTATVLRRLLWRTRFIAITGSNGKSTVTRVLAAVLAVDTHQSQRCGRCYRDDRVLQSVQDPLRGI